jgi:recombination protein RecR
MSDGGTGIEALISLISRLPGLGPRSARRVVLMLLKKRTTLMAPLAQALSVVAQSARDCTLCGNISTDDMCDICTNTQRRSSGEICVVEDVADLWAMERGMAFQGCYHILGGTLSPLDGIGPEDLRIPDLVVRVEAGDIREVILALSATVDGQTTAHYVAESLEASQVRVTSLAQGVPIGGELDYLDDGTIKAALRARRPLF